MKKWIWRGLWTVFAIVVVAILAFLVYTVASRTTTNNYESRLAISFGAAALTDGVHVKSGDEYHRLDEESCRKLEYYLTRKMVLAIGGGQRNGETIELLIGEDPLRVVYNGNEERAVVHFETMGKTYRIGVRDSSLWSAMRSLVGASHYWQEEAIGAQDLP